MAVMVVLMMLFLFRGCGVLAVEVVLDLVAGEGWGVDAEHGCNDVLCFFLDLECVGDGFWDGDHCLLLRMGVLRLGLCPTARRLVGLLGGLVGIVRRLSAGTLRCV